MKNKLFGNIQSHAVIVGFSDSSFRYTIGYVLSWVLLPVLVILSKLLKKEIKFIKTDKVIK